MMPLNLNLLMSYKVSTIGDDARLRKSILETSFISNINPYTHMLPITHLTQSYTPYLTPLSPMTQATSFSLTQILLHMVGHLYRTPFYPHMQTPDLNQSMQSLTLPSML